MMTRFQISAAALVLSVFIGSSSFAFQEDGASLTDATKNVLDASGSPAGAAISGDTLTYYLGYPTPLPEAESGVAITDTLSPNQTYVPASLEMPPGWSLASSPPFDGEGNSATFEHGGTGPGADLSFEMTVVTSDGGTPASGGGDGLVPIPLILNSGEARMYAIHHHSGTGSARIGCWTVVDLAICPGFPGSGLSLDGPDGPHATGDHFRSAVTPDNRIFYPTHSIWTDHPELTDRSVLGFGCWDAESDSPCPFVPLDPEVAYWIGNTGQTNLGVGGDGGGRRVGRHTGGVVVDPENPNRFFMFAAHEEISGGGVYCIDSTTNSLCSGWAVPILLGGIGAHEYDVIAEPGLSRRLFVLHGSGDVSCIDMDSGTLCSGWTGHANGSGKRAVLSPYLDAAGNWIAICSHQRNSFSAPQCFDANDGSSFTTSSNFQAFFPGSGYTWMTEFEAGRTTVLYAQHIGAGSGRARCYDFSIDQACAGFAPDTLNMGDYGYARDPRGGDCYLGLGHRNRPWRFDLNTGGSDGPACAIPDTFSSDYAISDYFCAVLPSEAQWETVEIHERPDALTGGTLRLLDSAGIEIWAAEVGEADSYDVDISALGAASDVTLEFTPVYSGEPDEVYSLELTFSANENPQICYQATVDECGPVWNEAVFQSGNETHAVATDLGEAAGPGCGAPDCFETDAEFNAATGRLDVSIDAPGALSGGRMALRARSDTVVILPQFQTLTPGQSSSQWSVQGLAPGESVMVQADLVAAGAGNTEGTDLCCSAMFEITAPEDDEDDNPESDEIDLAIGKTGDFQFGFSQGSNTITVTNAGADLSIAPGEISVTDAIPAGMNVTGASGEGWDCGSESVFPLTGAAGLICVYTNNADLAAGQSLPPIEVSFGAQEGELPGIENCANVDSASGQLGTDANPANDSDCWSGQEAVDDEFGGGGQSSGGEQPSIRVRKVGWFNRGVPCNELPPDHCFFDVTIEVENPGSGNLDVFMGDQTFAASGSPVEFGFEVSLQNGDIDFCSPSSGPSPLSCMVSVPPGNHSIQYRITLIFFEQSYETTAEMLGDYLNCFAAMIWEGAPPADPQSAGIEVADSGGEFVNNGAACTPFSFGDSESSEENEPDPGPVPTQPASTIVTPAPTPSPQCDLSTTFEDGGQCICRNSTLVEVSDTRCACPSGTEMGPNGLCSAPEPAAPATPDCPARHAYNPNLGQCVPLFCSPPMRMNENRTACICPAGQELIDGRCRDTGLNLDNAVDILSPVISDTADGPDGQPASEPDRGNPNCIPGGPVPCD